MTGPSARSLPHLQSSTTGPAGAPWVTFVPGIGNDASFWQRQATELAATHRVLRFEPWGCGGSEAPPEDLRIEDVAAGIVQLWDELGIESSSVVGLGFGGSTSLVLGLDHPGRVERIAAFCCRPRQPEGRRDFWRDRQAYAQENGLAELAEVTVDRWLSEDFRADHPEVAAALKEGFRRSSVEGYVGYVGAFVEMDFEDRLADLSVPTMLVAAENDHGGGPVEAMAAMADRMDGTELRIVTGSGHICNHEAPDQVLDLLAGFLA
ncbi:3-oxoadipate enol-lactonase [Raineyella antarctica]|uniref:3-oxoadipate enol-lactonase n=1 Tax=Raineyella antarctica TaxID=1577474 RepID=A0A1G6H180_9ACTN|nr:alpha/beta hydrolase [Raineyella antarctica]SDB88019.1 3-oxoadipate enol-lactonase [Raineyella antarctica]